MRGNRMKKEKIVNGTDTAEINNKKSKKDGSAAGFLVLKIVIAAIVLLVVFYFGFTCEVRESNAAIILRFGAPRAEITEAGL
jgi:regulator of protease activity HflC (stomatin/prohibitin superfamily)